jgi:hypothetical protein
VDTVSKRPRRDEPRSDVRTAANGCKRQDDPRGQKADGTKVRAEMMLTRGVTQAGAPGVSLARSMLDPAAPAREAGWS